MAGASHKTEFHENDLLYSTQFGDHYYSRNDGRAECGHVFLSGNGLPDRWERTDQFSIGELGFGTGLNFLTTWQKWCELRKPGQQLDFVSVEGFPLERETAARALGRWPEIENHAGALLDQWDQLGTPIHLDHQTSLWVHIAQAREALPRFPMIDAWFLDGFAPARNPDMWSVELMQQVFDRTRPGGTCATYTAAGWVRRNLEASGFTVEKRAGFGTKRDMTIGRKTEIKG